MKLVIEQTGPDGKSKFIEKVATGRPEGSVSMTEEVFEEAICEQQLDIEFMKEGKAKIEALLRFADYCIEYGEYCKGYLNYSSALERTISEGKIIEKYKELAERAYQGIIRCNSCDDECIWEDSSGLLEEYRNLFQHDEE